MRMSPSILVLSHVLPPCYRKPYSPISLHRWSILGTTFCLYKPHGIQLYHPSWSSTRDFIHEVQKVVDWVFGLSSRNFTKHSRLVWASFCLNLYSSDTFWAITFVRISVTVYFRYISWPLSYSMLKSDIEPLRPVRTVLKRIFFSFV